MIRVVAAGRLHPGRSGEYETAVAEIMPRVRAANPGILFFHAGKCRDAPDTYRVIEAYSDQEAMDRHVGSDSLQRTLRSAELSVGKECGSTCRARWSPAT